MGTRPLNKALLDTDIFSEITKGVNPTVADHALSYRAEFARYTIPAITCIEVVRRYQASVPVIPIAVRSTGGRRSGRGRFRLLFALRCMWGTKKAGLP